MIEKIERPVSLVEATLEGIRSGIINGEFALGQQITESYLSKTFGLSKTPIREALSLLKSEGLVESEIHKGFRVFKMDELELYEFSELRFSLESQALSSAFKKNRLELVRKLKNVIQEMEECVSNNEVRKFDLLDTKFHKTFFLISGNRYLLKSYENISGIIETLRTHTHKSENSVISFVDDHMNILKFIEMGEINQSKNELDRHIKIWINDKVTKSLISG